MRYTITRQRIQVIGTLWMGGTAATVRDLSSYDLGNIPGDVHDRDAVESWIALNMGDFQHIEDFRADFHIGNENIIHEWKNEESELTYNDCMFPEED